MQIFKSIRINLLLCFALLFVCGAVYAQPDVNSEQIGNNLKQHIEFLCSPKLMGRSTLTGHDRLASLYVDSVFLSFNLMGFPNFAEVTYTQKFNVYNTISTQQLLIVNDETFLFKDDFVYVGKMPPLDKQFEVVFGGVFNEQSIKKLDLSGKALLVFAENFGLVSIQIQQVASDAGCS